MFYRLIENLKCLICGNFPLQIKIKNIKSDYVNYKNIHIKNPHCSLYCGREKEYIKKLNIIPKCKDCYNDYILEGYFLCDNCKKQYPIHNGIPYFLQSNLINLKENLNQNGIENFSDIKEEIIIKKEEMEHFNEGAKEYEDYWVDHPRMKIFSKRAVKIWSQYVSNNNEIFVDIGCGSGRGSILMAEHGYLIGLDISFKIIEILKTKAYQEGFAIDCVVGDAENLPFCDNCIDFTTFWSILHHLPRRFDAYNSAKRILKKGGKILISEPNINAIQIPSKIGKILNSPLHTLKSIFGLKRKQERVGTDKKLVTEHETPLNIIVERKILNMLGFEIIYSTTRGFFSLIPMNLIPNRIVYFFYRFLMYIDIIFEKTILKDRGIEFCLIATL